MNKKQGEILVREARKVVESAVKEEYYEIKLNEKWLTEKKGVFVTLEKYPSKMLRGCVGFSEPIFPLKKGLVKASEASAMQDTRFLPVRKDELEKITVEVSVLNEPKQISFKTPEEAISKIKIGEDGLIVELNFSKGLLLPQVPEEFGWDVKDFLEQTCIKAGLPFTAWRDPRAKVYTFQSSIFRESKPNGEILQIS
ncbi:MAG: TIGR00296 family protein [Candidatus Nanoarchaeia archaeon]|nr:TIGR00296 family protein [Candidatus Nanoarchaeia archaeon]